MSASAAAWKLVSPQSASLTCGPLAGFAQFQAGCVEFILSSWNGASLNSARLLASSGPDNQSGLRLADLYVRGADLIADFVPGGPHQIAPHVYWRAAFESRLAAVRIELVLSVRTDLLDSAPNWSVTSHLPNAALSHAHRFAAHAFEACDDGALRFEQNDGDEHLFVFRRPDLGLSYAEMTHPSDFVSAHASVQGHQSCSVRSTLFPEHLEKGVIRRARICGWFMPLENDLETAVRLARQFVDEPLPLTT